MGGGIANDKGILFYRISKCVVLEKVAVPPHHQIPQILMTLYNIFMSLKFEYGDQGPSNRINTYVHGNVYTPRC